MPHAIHGKGAHRSKHHGSKGWRWLKGQRGWSKTKEPCPWIRWIHLALGWPENLGSSMTKTIPKRSKNSQTHDSWLFATPTLSVRGAQIARALQVRALHNALTFVVLLEPESHLFWKIPLDSWHFMDATCSSAASHTVEGQHKTLLQPPSSTQHQKQIVLLRNKLRCLCCLHSLFSEVAIFCEMNLLGLAVWFQSGWQLWKQQISVWFIAAMVLKPK